MIAQIESPVLTYKAASDGIHIVTHGKKYIDPNVIPAYKQFHKLNINVMLINATKKVFFCPGISRCLPVDGYNGTWQTRDIQKNIVMVNDTKYNGDYWMSLREVFKQRIEFYELMKEDLLEKENESEYCLSYTFRSGKYNHYVSEIQSPDSTGISQVIRLRARGSSGEAKIKSLILDACITRCDEYIDMMQKTLELVKKPKENLIDYDDWLAGKSIVYSATFPNRKKTVTMTCPLGLLEDLPSSFSTPTPSPQPEASGNPRLFRQKESTMAHDGHIPHSSSDISPLADRGEATPPPKTPNDSSSWNNMTSPFLRQQKAPKSMVSDTDGILLMLCNFHNKTTKDSVLTRKVFVPSSHEGSLSVAHYECGPDKVYAVLVHPMDEEIAQKFGPDHTMVTLFSTVPEKSQASISLRQVNRNNRQKLASFAINNLGWPSSVVEEIFG